MDSSFHTHGYRGFSRMEQGQYTRHQSGACGFHRAVDPEYIMVSGIFRFEVPAGRDIRHHNTLDTDSDHDHIILPTVDRFRCFASPLFALGKLRDRIELRDIPIEP